MADQRVPAALVASVMGMVLLHADCTEEFCRHGSQPGEPVVHKGPCRGWKEMLRRVAPGALHIIEAERHRKLAERRAARGKAAKPGKPDLPPGPPPVRPVLSADTIAAVNDAARAIPQDEAGWHAATGRVMRPPMREIDANIAHARREVERTRPGYEEAVAKAGRQIVRERYPRSRRKLSSDERQLAEDRARYTFGQPGRNHFEAQHRLEQLEQIDQQIKADLAAGKTLNPLFAAFDRVEPQQPVIDMPRDSNGRRMPTAALTAAHGRVEAAGRAMLADIDAAASYDPELQRIDTEMQANTQRISHGESVADRSEGLRRRRDLRRQATVRRKEMILEALAQVRPMGGERHTNIDFQSLARSDAGNRLAVADAHFPDTWVRASNRGELLITASDRAYFSGGAGDWESRTNPVERRGTLAMNTDNNIISDYQGGFADYVDEVTVHEMGHRMEQQIPGIKALEYTYVRSMTRLPNGDSENAVSLKEVYPSSSYSQNELTYRDRFANAYTGKTYEIGAGLAESDPAASSWEVFQVGLQQLLGQQRTFGDRSLTEFTLGVLATVGRDNL